MLLRSELILLSALFLIQFTHILDFVIIMPLGEEFMSTFGVDNRGFGIIVSSYTISAGFFSLISAFFQDRFDRKKTLIFCYVGFIAGTLFCAISPDYRTLVFSRIMAGAFGGVLGSSILAILGDIIPFERRGKASGILMASFSLATIAGVPIGLRLAHNYGWNSPFLALSGASALILVYSIFTVPNVTEHLKKRVHVQIIPYYMNILKEKNHLAAFTLTAVMMMAGFSVIPFISPYMQLNLGFSKLDLELVYFCGGAATFITSVLIGFAADRFGKMSTFTALALLSCIPLLAVTNLPQMEKWKVLIVSTSFFVLVSGRFVPAMAIITSSVNKQENRGGFMSLNTFTQQVASGIAATVSSIIITQANPKAPLENYPYVGIIAVICSVLSILLIRMIRVSDPLHPKK